MSWNKLTHFNTHTEINRKVKQISIQLAQIKLRKYLEFANIKCKASKTKINNVVHYEPDKNCDIK